MKFLIHNEYSIMSLETNKNILKFNIKSVTITRIHIQLSSLQNVKYHIKFRYV